VNARRRLLLLPERPERAPGVPAAAGPADALKTKRVVIALTGEQGPVLAFANELVMRAQGVAVVTGLSPAAGRGSFSQAGACSTLDVSDDSVGGASSQSQRQRWLDELPREAWVLAVGATAGALFEPAWRIGLGRHHETAATDLWLGQSSELVAAGLVEALRGASES